MKSRLGTALLVAAAFFALAAIWIPEYRWELSATTVLLFIVGEALREQKKPKKEKRTICLRCSADYPSNMQHHCPALPVNYGDRDPYAPFDPPPTKPYRSSDGPAQNGAI